MNDIKNATATTAIKVAVYKDGSLFSALWPHFQRLEQQGILEVVALASEQQGKIVYAFKGQLSSGGGHLDGIFLPAARDYWPIAAKLVQAGVPEERIWDARVVPINGMDWQRFLVNRTVFCPINDSNPLNFSDISLTMYNREYKSVSKIISLGHKSYIAGGKIEGRGKILIGNHSSVSWDVLFELGLNNGHDSSRVFTYDAASVDWPAETNLSIGSIIIGSDVWIARGCRLKASGSRPLSIGDGAVIAADSVVVSDVPPFAIVGGNPARLIKWRFPEDVRRNLLEIRWWDWPLEKLYQHRDELSDPLAFVQKHCPEK